MNSVMVNFESVPPDLTVDRLTAMIQAEFPKTRIINRDWYGEFRRHEVATIEKLRSQGNPLRNAEEIVLASTDRASAHYGPAFTIEIPMGESTLQGRICRSFMLLGSVAPIDYATADRLFAVFDSLAIVRETNIVSRRAPKTSGPHSAARPPD
jgi:hypothetical protein